MEGKTTDAFKPAVFQQQTGLILHVRWLPHTNRLSRLPNPTCKHPSRWGFSALCVSTWDAMSPDQLPASWGATQLASQGWQAKATQWDGTCLALELPVPLPWAQRQQRLGFWFCFVRWVYLCSWVSLALDASFAHPFPRLLLCSLALTLSLSLSRRSATCFVSQKSSSW